ncbi:MAG TPA: Crp/Fnr family transcriptional regulator [Terriglobales bacterium]
MAAPYGLEVSRSCEECALKKQGFFCNLPQPALKTLDAIRLTNRYPEGAILFVEQEAPRGVFVLCKGRIKLSMTSSEGKTVILRILQPGEVLGLHAVVSGRPYQATATTLEPCQVNFVRREDFLRFLSQQSAAMLHVAEQLSNSYEDACEQVRSLGLAHSVSEKLARFLLQSSAGGEQTTQGIRVRMTMTHEEIGQAIGSARETVTRTFAEFKKNHVIAVHGSVICIPDRTTLATLANT